MRTIIAIAVFSLVAQIAFGQSAVPRSGVSAVELETASQISQTISTSEWLGPLAPVALSPFFGMACLSGLAQFGPESMVDGNGLLAANSPLRNPAVFWTFGVLSVVTSLPRLTKVSKPIAGALEQLESYSSIISLVAIRYLISDGTNAPSGDDVVYAAGLGEVSIDAMLSIAAAINIIVINAVKFFFEFLIWLVPFPTLDAIFEAANKTAVAGLMAVYTFSPAVATVLNLVIFAICAVLFIWTRRQVIFIRTMLVGLVLSWLKTGKAPPAPEVVVFPKDSLGPFPARERLVLSRTSDGFLLTKRKFFGGSVDHPIELAPAARIEPGWIAHTVVLNDDTELGGTLLLSRSHTKHLDVVAALLRIELAEVDESSPKAPARDQLGSLKPKPV